jgi:hypothetical protein
LAPVMRPGVQGRFMAWNLVANSPATARQVSEMRRSRIAVPVTSQVLPCLGFLIAVLPRDTAKSFMRFEAARACAAGLERGRVAWGNRTPRPPDPAIAVLLSSRESLPRARSLAAISRTRRAAARRRSVVTVPAARGLHPPSCPHQLADRPGQQPGVRRVGHVRRDHRGIRAHPGGAQQLRPAALASSASFSPATASSPHRVVSFISVVGYGTLASSGIRQNRRQEIESLTSAHRLS